MRKTLIIFSLFLITCSVIACSSNPPKSDSQIQGELYNELEIGDYCKYDGYIRQVGLAKTPEGAFLKAKAGVSRQIREEISAIQVSKANSFQNELGESWNETFTEEILSKTNFEQGSMIKSSFAKFSDGWYGNVACVEKALVAESLEDQFNVDLNQFKGQIDDAKKEFDPKNFKMLNTKIVNDWSGLVRQWAAINVLKNDAKSYSIHMVEEGSEFVKVQDVYIDYQNYLNQKKANFSLGWIAANDPMSNWTIEFLSASLPVKEGFCEAGLNLQLVKSQVNCKNTGLGLGCSANPQLVISTCEGLEIKRFGLAKPAKGLSPQGEDKAMEKLKLKFKDQVINDWVPKLKEWIL